MCLIYKRNNLFGTALEVKFDCSCITTVLFMANKTPSDIAKILELQPKDSVPLYRQLYNRLRMAILSGQLKAGAQLPSTRTLANELGISRNTVLFAYEQLLAEGYVNGKIGSGTTVADVLPETLLATSNDLPTLLQQQTLPSQLSQRGINLTNTPFIPKPLLTDEGIQQRAFRVGMPALDAFPHEIWAQLIAKRAKHSLSELLNYRQPAGYYPLREAIASYLVVTRGVRCTAEQVILVAGSQGGIDLAARVLLDPGNAVWMEEPGYLGARGALEGAGANLFPVPVDTEGLDVVAGVAHCPQARLAYVTPSHQFPLGVTMSLSRRLALLEWANQNNAWLLEDDYDSEYRFSGQPLSAMQGLDQGNRTVYIGTFSKVLFPALRLGYVVVAPDMVEAFIAVHRLTKLHLSAFEQAVLADFITEGHFTRHIRRMRILYAKRRAILIKTLKDTLELEISAPDTGMHLILWLPPGMDDKLASQQAAIHGIDALPISLFSINEYRAGLMLGYAAVNEQEIYEGVQRLAKALTNCA
jgi:GntR family transcriptional regulator / MocR family aminotransferase